MAGAVAAAVGVAGVGVTGALAGDFVAEPVRAAPLELPPLPPLLLDGTRFLAQSSGAGGRYHRNNTGHCSSGGVTAGSIRDCSRSALACLLALDALDARDLHNLHRLRGRRNPIRVRDFA